MKILLIDNYDSFTFNLVQQLGKLSCKVIVKRNDELSLTDITKIRPDKIIISPGPKRPEVAGISLDVIKELGSSVPILGVCLGHQAIAICFGGNVIKAPKPLHGITSKIKHNGKTVFKNIPQNFNAMRYHSLNVDKHLLPPVLEITSQTVDGIIMSLRHKSHPVQGIQFHPESILTEYGDNIISNWLRE
jgi:anthranilate synthase/aminodeoxychorismate synthase-like glutamine amidotransferase